MTSRFIEQRRQEKILLANVLEDIKAVSAGEENDYLTLGIGRPVEAPPKIVGVLFSGGPAPGGNNVIAGLYDALQQLHPKCCLLGFLSGASGLLNDRHKEITKELIDQYRNLGGFHMLGTGRTKIESDKQFQEVSTVVKRHRIDALVFIGGDDTNTNAAHLARYFQEHDIPCQVIGIPKTIDGDLKTSLIEASFGFDTATKVYSEMIGNICIDAKSSLKYWHFIKLMGRKASHVTLECALQTQPNLALIGEEVAKKQWSLATLIKLITDTVVDRHNSKKDYGVCLLPEGIIEFIPEFKDLIEQLNRLLAQGKTHTALEGAAKDLFSSLPEMIKGQLLQDRDPHGNVQLSKIESEKLIYQMVADELKRRNFRGNFHPQGHFFGYEGRCSCPSYFDATYCYNLGYTAAALINLRKSGYMAALGHLHKEVEKWRPVGIHIESMMTEEERKGEIKSVIEKAVVRLNSPAFKEFKKKREEWRLKDAYEVPGPIQYEGPTRRGITKTLALEGLSKSFELT